MTYDYFATPDEQVKVLRGILDIPGLRVYELYSAAGQELKEYFDVESIIFDLKNGGQSLYFQLWLPEFNCQPIFRKVDLNPKYCNGHTFRYATNGIGLIQFYLGAFNGNNLFKSHLGHFEERGAIGRFGDEAKLWNWPAIRRISGKIKREIQKLATTKHNSYDVLEEASLLSFADFRA